MRGARSILRGDLGKIGLSTLLTLLDMERRGGVLVLQQDKQLGRLFVREGRVIRAQLEGGRRLSGETAVYRLLGWARGTFELWQTDVLGPDEIQTATSFLLLEAARRQDEAAEAAEAQGCGDGDAGAIGAAAL